MGMNITIEIVNKKITKDIFDKVFLYFKYIDEKFSTYIETSEITLINKGQIKEVDYSKDMKEIFYLSEETKNITNGYFDIKTPNGNIDPSGLVKGWSIYKASKILEEEGYNNFYIEAGGDIQVKGNNKNGGPWTIGIRNPLKKTKEIVKIISLRKGGLATSGTYARGQHIYNPHHTDEKFTDILSLSVIGPNIYEADRYATAAFAMGRRGINFIEELDGFEGYMIDKKGIAIMTTNFERYTK